MSRIRLPDDVVEAPGREGGRIVLVVLDGVGGLPDPDTGLTELETAETPQLDRLAREASAGMLHPVRPGIAPGSGPGHLALFGYDPVEHHIGRGVLSALGVGFELEPGDVAARLNLATFDDEGRVVDRRAGRPPDEEGRRIVEKVRDGITAPEGIELHFRHEKEHRAAMILRGDGLRPEIADTDPQETGIPADEPEALVPEAAGTADAVRAILAGARDALSDEPAANGLLSRGFAAYERYPTFRERYGLRARAVARYPMYRGVARLVGMSVAPPPETDAGVVDALADGFREHDFHFLHFKYPDSRGEDGDFGAKVEAIEAIDPLVGRIRRLDPDVIVVTGDHSTPSRMRAHSWHTVPVLVASRWARPTAGAFGESECRGGELGTMEARHLMSVALAHARRLAKFGA